MQHYISFFQFQSKFSTELRCYKFLFEQRWPDGFICPRCKHKHYSFHSTRKLYQCKACKYQASITAGTIFHKSRTSLRKWFWMIYLLSLKKPSYPIRYLQKLLEIKYYKTAWKMAHKIRDAMQEREDNHELVGILELDDYHFGTRNVSGKRDRGAGTKSPLFVALGNRKTQVMHKGEV